MDECIHFIGLFDCERCLLCFIAGARRWPVTLWGLLKFRISSSPELSRHRNCHYWRENSPFSRNFSISCYWHCSRITLLPGFRNTGELLPWSADRNLAKHQVHLTSMWQFTYMGYQPGSCTLYPARSSHYCIVLSLYVESLLFEKYGKRSSACLLLSVRLIWRLRLLDYARWVDGKGKPDSCNHPAFRIGIWWRCRLRGCNMFIY